MFRPTHIIQAGADRARRPAAALMGAAALITLSACATAQNDKPRNLSAGQAAQVTEACRTVLRLQPGEEQYDVCVDSLSGSLSTADQARLTNPGPGSAAPAVSSRSYFSASADEIGRREQLSCARLGFDPGGGDFTACVTSLAAALSAADTPQS